MADCDSKYGFYGHLNAEFPSQVIVDVTEFCNLACSHCPQQGLSELEGYKGIHLSSAHHKTLVDEVANDGAGFCKYIRYTGMGEPLLNPDFLKMIEYACKHSGVGINVTTNGVLLTEGKAVKLLDYGVDVLDISIDAFTPETYAAIRKKGDLVVTRANVLKLIKLIKERGSKTRVVVSFVVQPLNEGEATDFEKFWKNAGVDYVVIRRLHSAGGSVNKDLIDISKKRFPCLYPWERIMLAPGGGIHFCPQDWVYASTFCNIEDTTIKEAWQSDFMNKLREAHLKNDFTEHGFCAQCPDWATTRWPFEGRAYSDMMKEFARSDSSDKKAKS